MSRKGLKWYLYWFLINFFLFFLCLFLTTPTYAVEVITNWNTTDPLREFIKEKSPIGNCAKDLNHISKKILSKFVKFLKQYVQWHLIFLRCYCGRFQHWFHVWYGTQVTGKNIGLFPAHTSTLCKNLTDFFYLWFWLCPVWA